MSPRPVLYVLCHSNQLAGASFLPVGPSGSCTDREIASIQDHFLGLTERKLGDDGKHWLVLSEVCPIYTFSIFPELVPTKLHLFYLLTST